MSIKLQAAYPGLPSAPVGGLERRTAVHAMPLRSTVRIGWLRQAGKVVAATLIEAIVILGFVFLTLGIGEGQIEARPVGPPKLVSPAPAPPPGPVSIQVHRPVALLSAPAEEA